MRGYKFTNKSPEPEFITRCLIRDKGTLLTAVNIMKERHMEVLKRSNDHSSAFCSLTEELYNRFISIIKSTPIMTLTDKWWSYQLEQDINGLTLRVGMLRKITFSVEDDNEVFFRGLSGGGGYTVATQSVKQLTVEEYAAKYSIEEVTVRQWIRRGKLKSAKKVGNEWRIPELADIPKRGYENGTFSINLDYYQKREEIPEQYVFLRNADNVTILQNKNNKDSFTVVYDGSFDFETHTFEIDSKERHSLELFLMSTPYYHYRDRRTGGTVCCETVGGDSLMTYLSEQITLEDLEKTGPGIVAEDQFHLNMALDGFVIDDDKVWFEAK